MKKNTAASNEAWLARNRAAWKGWEANLETWGRNQAALMMLERPDCELGYTAEQVARIMGDRLPEFQSWGAGSTMAECDGLRYDYRTKAYEPTGCGPHGGITYVHDVRDFLDGLPVTD